MYITKLSWEIYLVIFIIAVFLIWFFLFRKKSKTLNQNNIKKDQHNDLLNSLNSVNISDNSTDVADVSDITNVTDVTNVVDVTELSDHYDSEKIISPGPKTYGGDKKKSIGETICCQTLERIYCKKFSTVRPDFLKNPETGRNLELDCYNHELKIAAEYNGIQHYIWPNYTPQTKEGFENQVRRDEFKRKMCDLNGIYLITIPYTVGHRDIEKYIKERIPN